MRIIIQYTRWAWLGPEKWTKNGILGRRVGKIMHSCPRGLIKIALSECSRGKKLQSCATVSTVATASFSTEADVGSIQATAKYLY